MTTSGGSADAGAEKVGQFLLIFALDVQCIDLEQRSLSYIIFQATLCN